ncbi:MAG: DUF2961 domain-containing protein [Planctomycetales bacterium]|nr:DUF2961 domain-containing protein [Planctomycetales bacterium]
MTCSLRCGVLGLAASFLVIASLQAGEPVTLTSLLAEMISRETLARSPQPAYRCRQASSYDRRSIDPADPASWFANADRSQWVRVEDRDMDGRKRHEYVMMDAAGPGAIVRFWGTWHGPRGEPFSNGTLRVYIDGNDVPAIEGPIEEVLDGGLLAKGPLSEGVSPKTPYAQRGHNLYLPIPYAKHCKVTYSTDVLVDQGAERGEAVYYQINYRTYEPETPVVSFSMSELERVQDLLGSTQKTLVARHQAEAASTSKMNRSLASGEIARVDLDGSQAIVEMAIKLTADDLAQALRSTVVKIAFDNEPCVWVPVGDFFGIGYEMSFYHTYFTEVAGDETMRCWWIMPFEKSATVALENLGDQDVAVDVTVRHEPWAWDGRSMHFHAAWEELHKVSTRRESKQAGDGAFNVNYVTIQGQGVYVGDTLTVFNGAAAWWGEGDETIYVDDETFPSHFGTGTEDYYGYAWCRPEKFSSPFHAQPRGDGNMSGGFSVNSRYRSLDAIPFRRSLRFDMELWHWADTLVNYAPTVFYYARPGSSDNKVFLPEAAARTITHSRAELGTIHVVDGAIEGENLYLASHSGGSVQFQQSGNWGWSNEHQLWWQGASVGDELVLALMVEQAGSYDISACLTKAPDYARVSMRFNDSQETQVFDRYHPQVATDVVELGTVQLKKGGNHLKVQILGHHDQAEPRGMFGLDYLKLTPK